MYDKILVPTDGSNRAKKALDIAKATAEMHNAEIHILNVIDQRNDNLNGLDPSAVNQLEQSRQELVRNLQEEIEVEGLRSTSDVTHEIGRAHV